MKNEDETRAQVLIAIQTPLGEAIRRWRLFRGISLTELANHAGISKGYLSQVEHNKIVRPNDEYLRRLADALSIEEEILLARQMPPSIQATADQEQRGAVVKSAGPNLSVDERPGAQFPLAGATAVHYPTARKRKEEALLRELQTLFDLAREDEEKTDQLSAVLERILAWFRFTLVAK